MDRLKSDFPHLKYYIAGDGPYRKDLERLVKEKRLEKQCIFLGSVTETQKSRLLDNCSALVMPSFLNSKQKSVEGFGIVFVEANSHGKPVIGTKSGGIPDAILEGETGFLIDEKNVEQLANTISDIISGKVTFSAEKCYDWAEKHYYKTIMSKYIDVFNRLLN